MGPKKIIYRSKSQVPLETTNGPSKFQNKLNHGEIASMYKANESTSTLDEFDVKITPPKIKEGIINNANVI